MKRYLLGVVMMVFVAVGYSQKAEAQVGLCPLTGTYADLISLGACTIDDKIFGDFDLVAAPGTIFTAADLGYSVVNTGGFEGFTFNFGLTAITGENKDFSIFYDVFCISGACLVSNELTIEGGGASAGGSVSVGETFCLDSVSVHNGGACGTSGFLFASIPGTAHQEATFAPVAILGLSKDINASCNDTAGCVASISIVTNTVDQVPEPATLALFGAGLAGLALFRRRRAL